MAKEKSVIRNVGWDMNRRQPGVISLNRSIKKRSEEQNGSLFPRGKLQHLAQRQTSSSILANEPRAFDNSSSDCDKISPWWDHTKSHFTTWADCRCEPGCTMILTSSQPLNWHPLDGDCQSTELSQRQDSLRRRYLLPATAGECKTVFMKTKTRKELGPESHHSLLYLLD